jgi:hypothetical protein
MQKKEIEMYLAQLGQELQVLEVQHPVRILLIGGAFMLIQVKNRQTTDDIDILLKDGEDATAPVLSQTFKAAIRAVAARNSLKGNWLNDIMSDFLWDAGNVPAGKLWRRYGKLEVFLPPKQYILALKLLAGRQKDVSDIQVLCQQLKIRTREQAQMLVDRYIPNKQLQKLNRLDETLNDFFPQP